MTRPIDVQVADVWREEVKVGTISRTQHGSVFEYDSEFLARQSARTGGLAVHLPYSRRRTEVHGTNLHPYFCLLYTSDAADE